MKLRWSLVTLFTAGIFFLSGWLLSFELPKARSWVLLKIEEISRDHLPVRILPGQINLSLLPLGASLENVKIVAKDEFSDILDPVSIGRVRIGVSPWQLIQGRLRLSEVEVVDAKVTARIPQLKEKHDGPPLDGLFNLLANIPITRLKIENLTLNLKLEKPRLKIDVAEVSLTAEKNRGAVLLDLNSSSTYIEDAESRARVHADLEANLAATRDGLTLSAFKVRRGDSFIIGSGVLRGDTEALRFEDIDVAARSELHLESMRNWAVKTFSDLRKAPALKGRAFIEAKFRQKAKQKPDAEFAIRTEGFKVDQFYLDRINTSGTFKNGMIKMPRLTLEHPAGSATLSESIVTVTDKTSSFETAAKVDRLQIHELLKTVGVGTVPVFLQVGGKFPCSGTISPAFTLTCKGKVHGEDLLIRQDMKAKNSILALREFDADGEARLDLDKVVFKAELAMLNSKGETSSKGRASGEVGYATGFKIDYEADNLAMKDIANLGDLKLEGTAKIKGTTEGDSHAAVFALDFDGSDIWFEDYWLGQAKTKLDYKAGALSFKNITGYYSVSRYSGDVTVDFHRPGITVNGKIPYFDMKDLMKVFSRQVRLPFEVTGTGQAQIKVSGPFAFNLLSYDLKSNLFKGSVAGETFDQATFDVRSVGGEVSAERVLITKGPATVQLTGTGHPDGNINTVIKGRGLKLEDSQIISNTGLAVAGLVDFDMDMNGYVLGPDTEMRGTLTKVSLGEQSVPDSNFKLKFNSKTLEGSGALLGDVVKASFTIPYEPSAPFKLDIDTHDWNFAPIFFAIQGPGGRKDYEGRLSAGIHLAAENGGFWNSTGAIEVSKYLVTRGPLSLRSDGPARLTMKNGQLHVERFELVGENTFFKLSDSKDPQSKIDVQVNGKLDLSLMSLLTPFFEDMRGMLSIAFNVKASPSSVDLLGSAYLDKAYLKFFDFPHPFEDIHADLLFNQKKLLVNSLKAEFGGGRVLAQGSMEFKGAKNYPVNLTGTFDKITMKVPDKVQTTGSGNFSFTGVWFPFLLKGDYNISDGMMTKQFGGESEQNDGIRRNYFLPEALLQDNFVPLIVDLNINFTNGLNIKNDLVDGRAIGAINVRGNPVKPSILGSITTDKETKLMFRDNSFEVVNSTIQFDDPNELNPKLYVSARSRVQTYDVNLLVQGTAQKPELALTSVPPLPEKDIISLLAVGATDTQLSTSITSQAQASQTGLQIGSGVLKNNPVSNFVKESTGFDVQLAPSFDETNSAVQKVIITRQFTPDLGVTASRSFGKKSETDARLRYRLNERLSVVGSWKGTENQEVSDQATSPNASQSNVGVDLEYKIEFK